MKRGIAAAVVAVALAGTACSGGGHDASGTTSRRHSSSAPSATTTTEGGITVTTAGGLTVESGNVGPVRLGENNVVYPYSDTAEGNWNLVASAGLADLRPHQIAHTEFDAGLINWVAATGDWVAYVDQSARQADENPNVLWRVHAVNPASGEDVVLATNGSTPDPYVPIVHGHDGYLFWTQAEPDRSAKEVVWRPGTAEPTVVLRHTEMTPGSESVSEGNLVYLGPAADRRGRVHTTGGDCWQVPLSGGTPEPITDTALAMGCEANDGHLVWTEHIDPTVKDLPPDGLLDDPYELWTEEIGGEPKLLHRGYIQSGDPGIGDGFALWQASDGTRFVQNLGNGKTHRLAKAGTGFQPAVTSGLFVARASGGGGDPLTIHVDEVSTR